MSHLKHTHTHIEDISDTSTCVCVCVRVSFAQIIVIFYGRREGNEMENQIKYLNRHREGGRERVRDI